MEYRRFGSTDLQVSVVGFGAWGIGGPAMVGTTPIGWGDVDDELSRAALRRAHECGINFYDTADFYGLGHSETLIGETFGNAPDVVIATKVGHRATAEQTIVLDYGKKYIIEACERSLQRLRREAIDFYQLHSAKLIHLEQGECLEAMEALKQQGKIRYWGISLNTFRPFPEADFLLKHKLGDGFQVVLNIINQRARSVIAEAGKAGVGIIARMPLQFGLLTGKFTPDTVFSSDDHRSFRLTGEIISSAQKGLADVRRLAEEFNISRSALAISFCAGIPDVSTVIPGIKTPEQAEMNSSVIRLDDAAMKKLSDLSAEHFSAVMTKMEQQG